MKNALLCSFLGFCATSTLFAQDAGTAATRQAKGRVAWFVYTSMPEGLENPVSVMSGKDISKVTLSKRSCSEPVRIPEDGIIRIVRTVENPKEAGKPGYLTLAQATIPEAVSKALIILIPASVNPNGLLFQTKVQDLAAFKGGDWLYLNMTNLKVRVDMGKTSLEVKPGGISIFDAPAISEPISMPIRYSYYHQEKQKWKMLSASTIALYQTRREICIFSWDSKYERVDYHGITFPVAQ
jgi:hypothetical protein